MQKYQQQAQMVWAIQWDGKDETMREIEQNIPPSSSNPVILRNVKMADKQILHMHMPSSFHNGCNNHCEWVFPTDYIIIDENYHITKRPSYDFEKNFLPFTLAKGIFGYNDETNKWEKAYVLDDKLRLPKFCNLNKASKYATEDIINKTYNINIYSSYFGCNDSECLNCNDNLEPCGFAQQQPIKGSITITHDEEKGYCITWKTDTSTSLSMGALFSINENSFASYYTLVYSYKNSVSEPNQNMQDHTGTCILHINLEGDRISGRYINNNPRQTNGWLQGEKI